MQEIHQMLMNKQETCNRTCFSLKLDGVSMEKFCELKTIESLKEGSIIKLVEGKFYVKNYLCEKVFEHRSKENILEIRKNS